MEEGGRVGRSRHVPTWRGERKCSGPLPHGHTAVLEQFLSHFGAVSVPSWLGTTRADSSVWPARLTGDSEMKRATHFVRVGSELDMEKKSTNARSRRTAPEMP